MRGGKNGVREDLLHDLMVSEISVRHGVLGRTETFTSRWPGGTWGGQTSWLSEESVGHAILTLSSGPQSPHKAGCSRAGGAHSHARTRARMPTYITQTPNTLCRFFVLFYFVCQLDTRWSHHGRGTLS